MPPTRQQILKFPRQFNVPVALIKGLCNYTPVRGHLHSEAQNHQPMLNTSGLWKEGSTNNKVVTACEGRQFLISGILWVPLQPKRLTNGGHHVVRYWNKTNSRASVPVILLLVLVATIQER